MTKIIEEEDEELLKGIMRVKNHDLDTSLDHFIDILEKKGNPVYVLEGMISVLRQYFGWHKSDYEIFSKISFIEEQVLNLVLKSKTDTFENSMAIGQFIEILINNGLPREYSIIVASEFLEMGESTARTHNENYRKIYLKQHLKGLHIKQYLDIMYDKVVNEGTYSYHHSKFKKAFKDTKVFYITRRAEIEKLFSKE